MIKQRRSTIINTLRPLIALIILTTSCIVAPCWSQKPIIIRADQEIFKAIETNDNSSIEQLCTDYPSFTSALKQECLGRKNKDEQSLLSFYQHPALKVIYQSCEIQFSQQEQADLLNEIAKAFVEVQEKSKGQIKIPQYIFCHVSGLQKNLLIGSNWVSIAIDKYLGSEHQAYKQYLSNSDRRYCQLSMLKHDVIRSWILTEIPNNNNLLLTFEKRLERYANIIKILSNTFADESIPTLLSWAPEDEIMISNQQQELLSIFSMPNLLQSTSLDIADPILLDDSKSRNDKRPRNLALWLGWQYNRLKDK